MLMKISLSGMVTISSINLPLICGSRVVYDFVTDFVAWFHRGK